MLVLIGLIVSLVVALIIAKVLKRKFFLLWLCTVVTIGTVAVSILSILMIIQIGVTNESMLYLFAALLCWIASIVMWKG